MNTEKTTEELIIELKQGRKKKKQLQNLISYYSSAYDDLWKTYSSAIKSDHK